MSEALLVAENLTKDYGTFRALAGVNLAIAPGEVVGLLGPNGSGKSTALRIMLGFLQAERRAAQPSRASIAGAIASRPASASRTCPANCGSTTR